MHQMNLRWAEASESVILQTYGEGLLCSKQALAMRPQSTGRPPASLNLIQPGE